MQCFIDDGVIATAVRDSRGKLKGLSLGDDGRVPRDTVQLIATTVLEMLVADLSSSIRRCHPLFNEGVFKEDCRINLGTKG